MCCQSFHGDDVAVVIPILCEAAGEGPCMDPRRSSSDKKVPGDKESAGPIS
jgi:hypothetical protein